MTVESKAIQLITSPSMIVKLDLISLCRAVGSLSPVLWILFWYMLQELAACVLLPSARPPSAWQATASLGYCAAIGKSRMGQCDVCFSPYVASF